MIRRVRDSRIVPVKFSYLYSRQAWAKFTRSCIAFDHRQPELISNTITDMEKPDASKYILLTEGRATVLYESENQVFYNPVQQFNRDLSTCAIRAWSEEYTERKTAAKRNQRKKRKLRNDKLNIPAIETLKTEEEVEAREEGAPTTVENAPAKLDVDEVDPQASESGAQRNEKERKQTPFITILEALSATGLRALRYGAEIPLVKTVVANDFSPAAVKAIERNIAYNDSASGIVTAFHGDANAVMYSHKTNPFHVIDLDPYGTAAPFIDAAVQAVVDGGLLLITCTDLSILAGTGYPEKCFTNYGGMTCRTEFSHESGLRLVLSSISSAAARYGKAIEPLLSLSIDFYVRVFVRVRNSPIQAKLLASQTMLTYTCSGCGSTSYQPLGRVSINEDGSQKHSFAQGPPVSSHCDYCGFVHHLGGPMWAGPLHNKDFIDRIQKIADTLDQEIYKTIPRIKGMLTLAKEELDDPFYFTAAHVSSTMRCSCPPMTTMTSALLNAGYKVSPTHAVPGAIKTNASWGVIWDILREWIKTNPVTESNIKEHSPAKKLLERREPSFPVDFTMHPEANPPSRRIKVARYPQNPPNWGPKARAKGDKPFNNHKIQRPGSDPIPDVPKTWENEHENRDVNTKKKKTT
ncbi:N2,N2-dimethylguanosine tRNA methyltransferase-domain-containing protein [Lipomyces kononenkoae]|uniref:N2,N2-dimethylguanosine tRNA methyltransferase-domain-containing protein n=1 Tax=Lipomyces kononenkoae TaxID=34357 RepID=A0ACC3T862_LIPKO